MQFDPAQFPEGVNVEVLTAPRRRARCHHAGARTRRGRDPLLRHRHGRGRGRRAGHLGADTGALAVRVPGGEVTVTVTDATSYLRGPSVLVAHGEIADDWWRAQA